MPYSVVDMGLYFFLYSGFGWLFESVYCSFAEMTFVNRGFLYGPLCPIYGVGALLMFSVLLPIKRRIRRKTVEVPVMYLSGVVLATVLEYVTSLTLEWLFDARWWDYSMFALNLNGRVCLWVSLLWGFFALLFVYAIQPLFEKIVARLHRRPKLAETVFAVGMILLAVDLIASGVTAALIGNRLEP